MMNGEKEGKNLVRLKTVSKGKKKTQKIGNKKEKDEKNEETETKETVRSKK